MDQRESPRYRVYLQVVIDGIELTANNISATGLQASCPDFLYGRLKDTVEQPSFQIGIDLPKVQSPCNSACKMIYHSEFGDEYLIGLEFLDEENGCDPQLQHYLDELAANNAPMVE